MRCTRPMHVRSRTGRAGGVRAAGGGVSRWKAQVFKSQDVRVTPHANEKGYTEKTVGSFSDQV